MTLSNNINCDRPNPVFLIRPNFAFPEKNLHQLSNFATTTSTTTRRAISFFMNKVSSVAKYEKGIYYKDILQIADKAMYENKKYLKEKYNMKGR